MTLRGIKLEEIVAIYRVKSEGKNLEDPPAPGVVFICCDKTDKPYPNNNSKKAMQWNELAKSKGILTKKGSF